MDEAYLKEHGVQILTGALIVFLVILLCGTFLEKHKLKQYSEYLQQEKFKYKKQIQNMESERDALVAQLDPFLARADLSFPDAPAEERLQLLIMKLDESNFSSQEYIGEIEHDRVIPDKDRFYIANGLKFIPQLALDITYSADDPESGRLARQIKNIFDAAGWKNSKVYPSSFSEPINDLVIEFGDKPSRVLQKALLPLYDTLNSKREAVLNVKLPQNGMKIIVGQG